MMMIIIIIIILSLSYHYHYYYYSYHYIHTQVHPAHSDRKLVDDSESKAVLASLHMDLQQKHTFFEHPSFQCWQKKKKKKKKKLKPTDYGHMLRSQWLT